MLPGVAELEIQRTNPSTTGNTSIVEPADSITVHVVPMKHFSRFSSKSEAFASELLKTLEKVFNLYL